MSADGNDDIVRAFCAAWEQRDLEAILAMLSETIRYQNVPAPVMVGRDDVRAFIEPIVTGSTAIEFIVTALAASADGAVLTERIDKIHYGERSVVIPLMGIFRLVDGMIDEWRDYADHESVASQFAALQG